MNFVKKHYEKVLLGAVLLGLFAVLSALPFTISADKEKFQQLTGVYIHPKPKVLPALDMSPENSAMDRVQSDYELDFENTNRLFNPMQWQKTIDGHIIELKSGNEVGPAAVEITKIVPLYYIVKLDNIEPSNEFSGARYVVSIERQDAPTASQRRAHPYWLSVGDKNTELSLISASGPADNPLLMLQLVGSGEQVTVSKNKSYREVAGYAADLKYPLEPNKHWDDQRVGAMINLSGDDYKVVVIDTNEVVLSAESNHKKTTRQYQP